MYLVLEVKIYILRKKIKQFPR